MKRVAAVLALALAVSACAHDTPAPGTIKLADPGHCVPVDISAEPQIEPLVHAIAHAFNGSRAAHFAPKQCAFARVVTLESSIALNELLAGWPHPDRYGAPPLLWAPGASAWVTLANQQLAQRDRSALATTGIALGNTPLVIAMPDPFARALGWPSHPIGWSTLATVAARGWAAYGHPEWGAFRLGKANPNFNTAALLETLAVSHLGIDTARALEAAVPYYGDTSWNFVDNWARLDAEHKPLTFVSAVVTDQRTVTAYNEGSANGNPPSSPRPKSALPHTKLVAITPNDGQLVEDHPLVPLAAPWVNANDRKAARAFTTFAATYDGRTKLKTLALTPAGNAADIDAPALRDVGAATTQWSMIRKPARVLLLFDVSDSMGDPSNARYPKGPTKIALAKQALLDALPSLGPNDEVGLRIFSTNLPGDWKDVVPIGRLATNRTALVRAIDALARHAGSPLYAATRAAYETVAKNSDPARINGVVLLTDGYNETGNNDRDALLAQLHDPTRVFTISYTGQADLVTLRMIAQATNARFYDATDPQKIGELYADALSNF